MTKHILSEQVVLLGSDIKGKKCSCGAIHPLDPKTLEADETLIYCTECRGIKTPAEPELELHTLPACKC
jgi:hypothetical protein